ncbi:hypothetical protein Nepgr_010784 [Nepenthes gracilis]|uniref:Membrane-associated kinase regulator n=1 Tax=Nepenthes gracilis TaxID=150966 RepID=A0AAD3SE16_NEPGR|nr:hypothetical protein Nepgr_010784 [Nepenthes gracilis]
MKAFALLKFWKTASAKVVGATTSDGDNSETTTSITDDAVAEPVEESDDDDESFFELELTLPDYEPKRRSDDVSMKNLVTSENGFVRNTCDREISSTKRFSSMSRADDNKYLFQRKTEEETDIQFGSKPLSPISILRSSPKLRVLMFGRLGKSKAGTGDFSNFAPKQSQPRRKIFTLKFRVEDASIMSKFSRSNSSSTLRRSSEDSSIDGSSKRFSSKDGIEKYLNLIKPLYVKVSKIYNDKAKFADRFAPTTTSFQSPSKSQVWSTAHNDTGERQNNRFRMSYKHQGKSRSSSSIVGVTASPWSNSPANRKDDSLAQQHDGIQGAILHCKRSLDSSRDRSSLSKCPSVTSHEKSIEMSE